MFRFFRLILFFLCVLTPAFLEGRLRCSVTGTLLAQDTSIYLNRNGLVVVHASAKFPAALEVKEGMDEIIAFHESMDADTYALVHDDGSTWITEQKEFTGVVYSENGPHSMRAPRDGRVASIGGYIWGCQKGCVRSFISNRVPGNTHIDLPIKAIYGIDHGNPRITTKDAIINVTSNTREEIGEEVRLIQLGLHQSYRKFEIYLDDSPHEEANWELDLKFTKESMKRNVDLSKVPQRGSVRLYVWSTNQKYKDSFKPKE